MWVTGGNVTTLLPVTILGQNGGKGGNSGNKPPFRGVLPVTPPMSGLKIGEK